MEPPTVLRGRRDYAIYLPHPGSIGKTEKIFSPAFVRGAVFIGKDKMVHERFTCAGEFSQARSGFRIANRQIEQLKRPLKCKVAVFGIALFLPKNRPLDFASDVAHLFNK